MRSIFLTIFIFWMAQFAFSQTNVKASVERNSMRLGEQTTLKVRVNLSLEDSLAVVKFPINEELIPVERVDTPMTASFEVVEFYLDTLKDINSGMLSYEKNYIITSWDTGVFVIDSMKVLIDDSVLFTNSTFLQIGDVPVDTTKDIVDIKDIYSEEGSEKDAQNDQSWWSKNWIWITITCVLLLAAFFGWFFYFRKGKEVIEVKAKLPAHQIALQRLSSLKKKDLIKKGLEKEYYSEITDIIRVYLEDRYSIHALELTSNEIINRLKFENISPDDKFILKEIFQTSDLVKFAKLKPSEMDNENTLFKAEEFVRHTKFIEEFKDGIDSNE
ncbi:MAG: hypothetical protein KDC84_01385 [Crocinitomicaceae bacterium]|nr:hypothetical protein [Crocinitomicaceae bacterium]